jgi:hypothetical protein
MTPSVASVLERHCREGTDPVRLDAVGPLMLGLAVIGETLGGILLGP